MSINKAHLIQIKAALLKEAVGPIFRRRRANNQSVVQPMPFQPQQNQGPAAVKMPYTPQPNAPYVSPVVPLSQEQPAPQPAAPQPIQQPAQPSAGFGGLSDMANRFNSATQTLNNQRTGFNQLSQLFGGPQIANVPEQSVPSFEIPPGTPQGGGEPGAPVNQSSYDKLRQGLVNLPSTVGDFYQSAKNRQGLQARQLAGIKALPGQYGNIYNQMQQEALKNYMAENQKKRYEAIARQDMNEQMATGMGQDYDRYGSNNDSNVYTKNLSRGYDKLIKTDPGLANTVAFNEIGNFAMPALANREFNRQTIAKDLEQARINPGFVPNNSVDALDNYEIRQSEEPAGVPNSLQDTTPFVDMSPGLRTPSQSGSLAKPTAPALTSRDRARALAEDYTALTLPADPAAASKLKPQPKGAVPKSRASLANLGDLGTYAGDTAPARTLVTNKPEAASPAAPAPKPAIPGYSPSITDPAALVSANTPGAAGISNNAANLKARINKAPAAPAPAAAKAAPAPAQAPAKKAPAAPAKQEAPDFLAEAKGMQGRIDSLMDIADTAARSGSLEQYVKHKRMAESLMAQQKQMRDIHHHNAKQQREAGQQDAMEAIRQRALAAGMALPDQAPKGNNGVMLANGRKPYQRPPENTVVGAPRIR